MMVAAWLGCAAWALSSPPGSSPDEWAHLASAWEANSGQDISAAHPVAPVALVNAAACLDRRAPVAHGSAGACIVAVLASSKDTIEVANSTASYPPLFHRFLSVFVGSDLARSVYWMRLWVSLVSVLLVAFPLLVLAVSRGDVQPVAVASAIAMGPLAWFLISSINPSAWEMAGAVCAWGCGLSLVLSHGRAAIVLSGIGIAGGLAVGALSKPGGGSLAALGLVLAAPLWLSSRARGGRRNAWAWWAAAYAGLAVVGMLAVARGALDVDWGPHYTRVPITWHLLLDNLIGSPDYVLTSLGPVGWLDTATGTFATLAFLGAGGYLVLSAFRQGHRVLSLCLAAVTLAACFAPAIILTASHSVVGVGFQSRYIWPLAVGTLFVACLGLALNGRLAEVLGGHVRLVVVSTLTLGTMMALWLNIQRYARTVVLGFPYRQTGPSTWAPPALGTAGTVLLGLLAFAAFYTLTLMSWNSREPAQEPRGDAANDEATSVSGS